jgi:hypothetical protein
MYVHNQIIQIQIVNAEIFIGKTGPLRYHFRCFGECVAEFLMKPLAVSLFIFAAIIIHGNSI